MINHPDIICSSFRRFVLSVSISICLFLLYLPSIAQEQPPKPIKVTVSTSQHLSFGSFIQSGNSGTVTVTAQGARTATGSIILSNIFSTVTAALFQVEAIPGTLITISNGPDATLTGSNSGTMILTIGESYPQSPFIATGIFTSVNIGGTLTVGPLSANPGGDYSGTFTVTFIQQ